MADLLLTDIRGRKKKLVVNPKEAEEIKSIFETYTETGSLQKLIKNLKMKE